MAGRVAHAACATLAVEPLVARIAVGGGIDISSTDSNGSYESANESMKGGMIDDYFMG